MPGRPAELSVGRRLQAEILLQLHDLADRLVLDAAQLLGVDLCLRMTLARLKQPRRPQQAAHVIRTERGLGA